jgi:hydrogenase 3 maturation protease
MEELKRLLSKKFLFIGVGNPERGDDGIGTIVVSKLETEHKLDCGPVPENYTGKIRRINPEVIIMVDAVDFGGNPGDVALTEAENAEGATLSTHSMPMSIFCKMVPESKVYILGIQPKSFESMSDENKASGEALSKEINRILKQVYNA